MRIFRDCEEMVKEMDRDLMVQGISVEISHYQNKKLTGDERITKELLGVSFMISKPLSKRKEMLEHLFGDDATRIENYCKQEFADRVSGKALNPGNSYKIRKDMWQKFMIDDESRFDYTYSERMSWQLDDLIKTLREEKHTRQAVLSVWEPLDIQRTGGDTRVPCSVSYQFLIRNDRLYCVYYMRSNDFLGHHGIDIYATSEIMQWVVDQLSNTYTDLKVGGLYFFASSLHAYQWDLSRRIVF